MMPSGCCPESLADGGGSLALNINALVHQSSNVNLLVCLFLLHFFYSQRLLCCATQETTARDSMACLLLLRQADVLLASWHLPQAQAVFLKLMALVDSDSMLHTHPRSMRNECVCSVEVSIARYLWRVGKGHDATIRLHRVSLVRPPVISVPFELGVTRGLPPHVFNVTIAHFASPLYTCNSGATSTGVSTK